MDARIYTRDDREYDTICTALRKQAADIDIVRDPLDGFGYYTHGYDIVVVAVDGALGMEIALEHGRRFPDTIMIWITDDAYFSETAARRHIYGFIERPYSAARLNETVSALFEEYRGRRQIYMTPARAITVQASPEDEAVPIIRMNNKTGKDKIMKTLEQLYSEVMASDELKKEFTAAGTSQSGIEEWLKKHDCGATIDELKKFLGEKNEEGEIGDDEVEAVAGGKVTTKRVLESVFSLGLVCAEKAAESKIKYDDAKDCFNGYDDLVKEHS